MSGPPAKVCTYPSCDRKHAARGFCQHHYKREITRAGVDRRSPPIHIEDVEWMAETGETWLRAIDRLGVKENTLKRHLERAGRYDLIRRMQRRNVLA